VKSPWQSVWLGALAALVLGSGLGCARTKPVQRFPNAPIVLISIDTLRADHLPAYGYKGVQTPHLDRFRKDAILFENAYSHVPLTLPSHLTILTGLLPFEHGVRDNLGYHFDAASHRTLQRLLKDRGYATGGAISAWVLRGASGISDGFDFYEDRLVAPNGTDAAGSVQRRGDETAALATAWIEGVKQQPFFLFFHTYEPHAPYDPPEPYKSRFPLAYDGEVATSDAVVGRLLDNLRRLGLYDRAIIVVLSDHGEGLGEHGEDEHGILLYRWALHVPLLLKLPGSAAAGTTLSTPVGLTDVLPTLTSLVGVPAPAGLRGRSLLTPEPTAEHLYAETYYPRIHLGWSELRSLVDARFQYIEGAKQELYDVARDPKELDDQAAAQQAAVSARQAELKRYPAELVAPTTIAAEDAAKLAALGYLEGVASTNGRTLPDPRASLPALTEVKAGFRLAAAGRETEAVAALRAVLKRYPDFFDARFELAEILARTGRYAEAYDAYKAALKTSPSLAASTALGLGRMCFKLKRWDEAEANARLVVSANNPQGHALLAQIALARDDLATAEREAHAASADSAASLTAAVVLAEVAIRQERFADALAVLTQAKQTAQAQHLALVPDLDFLRGDALARLGRYPEAEAAFNQEIRSFPRNAQAYTRLAILYGLQHRRVAEVDRLLETMFAADPRPETAELAAKTLATLGDPRGASAWRRRSK